MKRALIAAAATAALLLTGCEHIDHGVVLGKHRDDGYTTIDSVAARLLAEPIRHVYALLWRLGILTTDKENKK